MTSEESHSAKVPLECGSETKSSEEQTNVTKDVDLSSSSDVNTCATEKVCQPLPNGLSETVGSDEIKVTSNIIAANNDVNSSSELSGCPAEPTKCESEMADSDREMVVFKIVYNKQNFNVTFPIDSTVRSLKEHVQLLTDVEVKNQKIMFKGLMKDDMTLREHKLTAGCKVMVVGSKTTDIQSVNQTTVKTSKEVEKASATSKEPLCKQKPHKAILDKYGKPEDVMPGIKGVKEALPPVPISGMYNKVGSKVRLTFKLESDQVWIGTKERTEKVGLTSIKTIVSEPIEGHEQYHMLGIQLGPTEASRYWIYWVPAQYVDSIKDTVLGNWQYF